MSSIQYTPLPYEVKGNPESKNLTIFIHGWPDDMTVWDETIKNMDLKNNYVLNLSYPNYSKKESRKLGLDFPEIMTRMKATIDFIDSGKNYKKVLVGHDWGAYNSYLFDKTYPKFIDKLICMDVSNAVEPTLKALIIILIYQWWCIWAFVIGIFIPKLGDILVQLLLNTLFKKIYPFDKYKVKANMCFFYFYLWKGMITNIFTCQKKPLDKYKPSVNLTYIYAKHKVYQLHNDGWLKMLQKNDHEVHALKGGHWIQLLHSKFLAELIQKKVNEIK